MFEDRVRIFDEGAGIYELNVMSDAGLWECVSATIVSRMDVLEDDRTYLTESLDMDEFWDRVDEIRDRHS